LQRLAVALEAALVKRDADVGLTKALLVTKNPIKNENA
jgi:hypothetical protein